MKNLKEELERERETMLREKEFLEKQLRDADRYQEGISGRVGKTC